MQMSKNKQKGLGCPQCKNKKYVQTAFFPIMFRCLKCNNIWTDEPDGRYEKALIARQGK